MDKQLAKTIWVIFWEGDLSSVAGHEEEERRKLKQDGEGVKNLNLML